MLNGTQGFLKQFEDGCFSFENLYFFISSHGSANQKDVNDPRKGRPPFISNANIKTSSSSSSVRHGRKEESIDRHDSCD